jgi:NTP pyrophosphatase (non-canonical NTP hydrolase)
MEHNDRSTSIEDLKSAVAVFCTERDWDQFHTNKDLAIGIVTEASELLELFRFKSDDQIKETMSNRREEVCDELSDSLYFIVRFAQINGIDLSSEFYRKLEKDGVKYPVEKAKGCNRKYDE